MTRSSWLPSAMPSSSAGWRRMIASTSVIFNGLLGVGRTLIVNYTQIVYNRQAGAGLARPLLDRPRRARASTWAGSSCRARTTRAAGRTSSSRSSRSRAATGRPRSWSAASTATSRRGRSRRCGSRARRAPEDVTGQLIVVPCASPDASRAYTRLWPSGANFNRSFPGSPDGPPDEQLADFFTRFLIPRADVVVDMHSGGRSGLCPPWSEMHWVDDAEQRRAMVDAMLAWGTDYHFVYIDIAGSGLLVGEAERQGKLVVSTELGGGGHVTAATHRIAQSGLANVLRHVGVLAGEVVRRDDAAGDRRRDRGRQLPARARVRPLGDVRRPRRPRRGRAAGRSDPLPRAARPRAGGRRGAHGGIVFVVRAIATTAQGDNVVVIAQARSTRRSCIEPLGRSRARRHHAAARAAASAAGRRAAASPRARASRSSRRRSSSPTASGRRRSSRWISSSPAAT